MNQLCDIFLVFFKISLVSLGGVFGVLPELERMVVTDRAWITHDQFIQTYVVGQFVPGPNMAMCPLIGYHVAGWPGWVAAFIGIYAGPVLIMGLAYSFFHKYRDVSAVRRVEISLRPIVAGLLIAAAGELWWVQSSSSRPLALGLSIAFILLYKLKKMDAIVLTLIFGFLWMALLQI